jgi:hypothetical protein
MSAHSWILLGFPIAANIILTGLDLPCCKDTNPGIALDTRLVENATTGTFILLPGNLG